MMPAKNNKKMGPPNTRMRKRFPIPRPDPGYWYHDENTAPASTAEHNARMNRDVLISQT
jgi:hypothetical protein